MQHDKQTLGQAIDQIIFALESLDDGARKTALMAVCAHLSIDLPNKTMRERVAEPTPVVSVAGQGALAASLQPTPARVDIRSLKDTKRPTSAQQMACLVAYYLKELAPEDERKDAIGASELEKYFKQAGFKLPRRLSQVLPDGKSAGYFDSANRGEYKLNAVGHNLVVHNLPSGRAGGE